MKVRTEFVDGLEFEVPTWDPTPAPWNESGSWAKNPNQEARLRAAILEAVPGWEDLLDQAELATGDGTCNTFWGSHGCSLTTEHEGLHVCGTPGDLCSAGLEYGDTDTLILWWCYVDEERFSRDVSVMAWKWYS